MKITNQLTDEALLQVIGSRLSELRIEQELTQKELAEEAGLGVRTVQRLEKGEAAVQLTGFLRVCRILGILENLEAFLPERGPTPMEQLVYQGKRRQRVRSKKISLNEDKAPWTWGDGK